MMVACSVFWAEPRHDPRLAALLSRAEGGRAARLSPPDRARFTTGRALARLVLGERLGTAPENVPIEQQCATCGSSAHGKPRLARSGPAFSISHAGERVGVAVTGHRAVGLDVEMLPAAPRAAQRSDASGAGATHDVDPDPQRSSLAAIALSTDERALYDALPPDERGAAIVRWWTRKEAVLKATGSGLATPPDLVRVTMPGEPPAVLGDPRGVVLRDLQPGAGYVATLAVAADSVDVDEFDATDVVTARLG